MVVTKSLTLKRKGNRPDWVFVYDYKEQGYVYHGRTHRYRLFFNPPAYSYKPFWIGMWAGVKNGRDIWVTIEHEIYAQEIEFLGSKIVFT